MKPVTAQTRVFAVIGDPIGHSLSPIFWNAAFAATGIDAIYTAFRVTREHLSAAVRGLAALGVVGFNVTSPHKNAIISELRSLLPPADILRAVNTVRCEEDGSMVGTNTDALAMISLLEEREPPRSALLLGAGGAASAVFWGLCQRNTPVVYCANRTPGRSVCPLSAPRTEIVSLDWNESSLKEAVERVDMVINATPLGRHPEERILPLLSMNARQTYVDLVYSEDSRLLADARSAGAAVINGREFLIRQGMAAFSFLTGVSAPEAAIRGSLAMDHPYDESVRV
ncbi:MAG: shikimate dehydrogenase [Candidatus Ozemobacteraceae bacterium]